MPPKGQKATMSLFNPSPEELEQARDILAKMDKKQEKAKQQAMANFMKRQVDDKHAQEVLSCRTTERREYLVNTWP